MRDGGTGTSRLVTRVSRQPGRWQLQDPGPRVGGQVPGLAAQRSGPAVARLRPGSPGGEAGSGAGRAAPQTCGSSPSGLEPDPDPRVRVRKPRGARRSQENVREQSPRCPQAGPAPPGSGPH